MPPMRDGIEAALGKGGSGGLTMWPASQTVTTGRSSGKAAVATPRLVPRATHRRRSHRFQGAPAVAARTPGSVSFISAHASTPDSAVRIPAT